MGDALSSSLRLTSKRIDAPRMLGGPRGGTCRGQLHIISRYMEAVMRVINFDKGSKRRIQEIRWTRFEILSAVLLSVITLLLCAIFALWEVSQFPADSQTQQTEEWR
jgi:hypothetical protein